MNVRFDKPKWMVEAEAQIGTAEIPGPKHNPKIVGWLTKLKAWWADDEVPWCGTFAAHCMKAAGIEIPKNWFRAKAWAEWGSQLRRMGPIYGSVLVFDRKGGGHVGFYVSEDATTYHVLGGNQSNKVCITKISKNRLVACRWPKGVPASTIAIHASVAGDVSKNEA